MAEYIYFNNNRTPAGDYNIVISFNTSVSGTTNYNDFILIDWGKFSFGGEDVSNELLVRANKTDIEFMIPDDSGVDYIEFLDFLLNNTGIITITTTTGNPIWKGFTDVKEIKNDYFNKTIKLSCKDGFAKNEKLDEASIFNIIDTIGRPTTADRDDKLISITRLISRLSNELLGTTPTIVERTRLYAALEDDTEYDSESEGLRCLATYGYNLLHWNLYNYEVKKSIQACLTALNSYAINGWSNKLYILPLYYRGKNLGYSADPNVFDINGNMIIKHDIIRQWNSPNVVPYYQASQAKYGNSPVYYKAPYFTVSEEEENHKIYFPCIGGTVSKFVADGTTIHVHDMDGSGSSNTLFWLENGGLGSNANLKVKGNTIKNFINGAWNTITDKSLYSLAIAYLTGNYESSEGSFTIDPPFLRDKYGLKIKIGSAKNSYGDLYSPHHEFRIAWYPDKIFRTRKMTVDLVANTTELSLLEY